MFASTIPGLTTECTGACPTDRKHAHLEWGSEDRGTWFVAIATKGATLSRARAYLDTAFGDEPDWANPGEVAYDAQRDGHTIRLTVPR